MSKRRAPLIVAFGPDGAGKSTQTKLLVASLRNKHKVIRIELSFRHLIVYLIARFFIRLGRTRIVTENRTAPLLPCDNVRLMLELLSIIPLVAKIRFFQYLGYMVVVEKYVPFTIASIEYVFDDSILRRIAIKMLSRFIYNDMALILLDIDYQTHLARRSKSYERAAWFNFQRRVYRRFGRMQNCLIIDTHAVSVNDAQNMIRAYVQKKIHRKDGSLNE